MINKQLSKYVFLPLVLSISPVSYADSMHDISSVISAVQASDIVNSLISMAPSGVSVNSITARGQFGLDDSNALKSIKLDTINFSVNYMLFKSNVKVFVTTDFVDGNCNNPKNIVANVSGTSSIIDGVIRDYVNNNSANIIRNNLLKQTGLSGYCRVKPTIEYPVEFY